MSRHAYCIIAHNDSYCLNKLLELLDDSRNDIYLLIDKKSDLRQAELYKPYRSSMNYALDAQLVDIQWGGRSQMAAELTVLQMAVSGGRYDYIHLLSGQDLPLKTQDYIHDIFDRLPVGTNCISFDGEENIKKVFSTNCRYFHLFTDKMRSRKVFIRKICSGTRKAFVILQKACGYHRDWNGYIPGKGTNWVSVSGEFAAYLVANIQKIFRRFRCIPCVDEIYKHTMFLSSPFTGTLIKNPEGAACLRLIDWERGFPYTWRKNDFEELVSSRELFARKFSSEVDKEIIDLIYAKLKSDAFV